MRIRSHSCHVRMGFTTFDFPGQSFIFELFLWPWRFQSPIDFYRAKRGVSDRSKRPSLVSSLFRNGRVFCNNSYWSENGDKITVLIGKSEIPRNFFILKSVYFWTKFRIIFNLRPPAAGSRSLRLLVQAELSLITLRQPAHGVKIVNEFLSYFWW